MGVIHVVQYLFCIHFCQFNLPLALHVLFLGNFIRRKYRHLYTFFLLLFRYDILWSDFLSRSCNFFLSEVTRSSNLVTSLFQDLTLFWRSILGRTYQGSFSIHSHPLISPSRVPVLCFFFSLDHLFLLSYSPSFEIGLYTSALCHRSRHFSRIFPICLRPFSFLLAISFATGPPFFLVAFRRFTRCIVVQNARPL